MAATATQTPATDVIDRQKLLKVLQNCNGNGRCQYVCPTLKQTNEQLLSPRGRIGELRVYMHTGEASPEFDISLATCLSCRACETVCPMNLPLGWLYDSGKLIRHQHVPLSETEKKLQSMLVAHLGAVDTLHALHKKMKNHQGSFAQSMVRGWLGRTFLPKDLARMERMMPPFDAEPTRHRHPAVTPPSDGQPPVLRVGLFVGCVGDIAYGHIHDATIRVLAASGCAVEIVADQVCCGAVHSHVGQADQTREQLANNARAFGFGPHATREPPDVIVANAAGCGAMLKEAEHYAPQPHIVAMSQRVRDVHELVHELWTGRGRRPKLKPIDGLSAITYHDACHLRHGQRIAKQPRWLLEQIPGLRLVEMKDADDCCGSAGTYNLVQPELADAIGDAKLANVQKTGCTTCAAGNLVCIGQMKYTAERNNVAAEFPHPMELLARALA